MSYIYKIGDRWYYQWRSGGKQRKKAMGTTDRATAKRLQARWDARLEAVATGLSPARCLVADTIPAYEEARAAEVKAKSVQIYHQYARLVAEMLSEMGVVDWNQFNDLAADEFKSRLLRTRSPRYAKFVLTWVKSLVGWLWRTRQILEIPVRDWPKIQDAPVNPDTLGFYTAADLARLREYFRGSNFEAIFVTTIYTGARASEVAAARVGDVNLLERKITLRNIKTARKTGKATRTLAMHPELVAILAPRVEGQPVAAPLFPEAALHSKSWPSMTMMAACKRLGIRYRRYHGIRHSVGTYLVAGGVDVRRAMSALGHASMATTMQYVHAAGELADTGVLPFGGGEPVTIRKEDRDGIQSYPQRKPRK